MSGPVTWRPAQALPPPTRSANVRIVLSPHPDDETLSLGVWAANAARDGHRVIVVCLTDGRGTKARTVIGTRLHRTFTRDEVAAARIGELRAAATALGVGGEDVVLAHLDGDATAGGSRLTQPEAYAVIRVMAERFPNATFATMSYTADQHPDHLDAGRALWQAMGDGTVRSGVFAVSRLWWHLPSPPITTEVPNAPEVAQRVRAAARGYGVWNPAGHEYAVGWTSVRQQFLDLDADPRDHLHSWQPAPGLAVSPAATGAAGSPGPSGLA